MLPLMVQSGVGALLGTAEFIVPLDDAGAGIVNTQPMRGAGSATFTRTTTAFTVLSTGLLGSVASGAARCSYNPSTLEYLGYLSEEGVTNVILQSQTLGTTWTVSNALNMNAVVDNQYTAPDGTATMDQLIPKATTEVHSLDQAFTFTVTRYTCSAYLRYVAATPQTWVAFILEDGTTTWGASFNIATGAVGDTSNCASTIEATGQDDVYRVTMTKSTNSAAAAGTVKISLNSTDTATLENSARLGTETLGVWGVQLEDALFVSSYIPTTTVGVARNSDVLSYTFAGNMDNTVGTCYCEVSAKWTTNGVYQEITADANTPSFLRGNGGATTQIIHDSSTSVNKTGLTSFKDAIQKRASSWGGVGLAVTGNSEAPATGAFDGSMGNARINLGGSDTGTNNLNGTLRNIHAWKYQVSDMQLSALTA